MKSLYISTFLLFATSLVFAQPPYFNLLMASYPGNKLGKIRCQACHNNGPALNLYGRAYAAGFSKFTKAEIFKQLDALDSDNDGISNGEEIMAGRNPGVAGK